MLIKQLIKKYFSWRNQKLRFCCKEFKEAYYRQDGEYPQIKIVKCNSALRVRVSYYSNGIVYQWPIRVYYNNGKSENINSNWEETIYCPFCHRNGYWGLKTFKRGLYDLEKYANEIEGETIRFENIEIYKECEKNITMK